MTGGRSGCPAAATCLVVMVVLLGLIVALVSWYVTAGARGERAACQRAGYYYAQGRCWQPAPDPIRRGRP